MRMKTLMAFFLLTIPVVSWGSGVGYLFGCAGKSCIEMLEGCWALEMLSSGGCGGSYGQPVAGGGESKKITIKVTERDAPEDDLYHINKKSVKFSGDVKFSGRKRQDEPEKYRLVSEKELRRLKTERDDAEMQLQNERMQNDNW